MKINKWKSENERYTKKCLCSDFPCSSVMKILPSNARRYRVNPSGQETKIPHASQSENQNINRSNNVTTSKPLKMAHIKKNLLKNKLKKIVNVRATRETINKSKRQLTEW